MELIMVSFKLRRITNERLPRLTSVSRPPTTLATKSLDFAWTRREALLVAAFPDTREITDSSDTSVHLAARHHAERMLFVRLLAVQKAWRNSNANVEAVTLETAKPAPPKSV